MNCDSAQILIQARLDRELDVERAIELGGHLALCPECRDLSADLEQCCVSAGVLPEFRTGSVVSAAALNRIRNADQLPRRNWRPQWAALAAGIAMILGFGGYFRLRSPSLTEYPKAAAPDRVVVPKIPPPHSIPVAPAPAPEVEMNQDPMQALLVEHYWSEHRRPEGERARERRRAELLRDLRNPDKAGDAAEELLDDADNATVWAVAASVSDTSSGAEVFAAAAKLKPDLRLVPVYIAALDASKTRARATELLCSASGKKFGSQKEIWLTWWAGARSQLRDD